jgi:hypothetical protein
MYYLQSAMKKSQVITNDLISVTSLLLLGTELEVLRPLQREVLLCLTLLAPQAQDDHVGRLGFLVENGLGLTTKTHLLGVIMAFLLGKVGRLAQLVLGYLVDLVQTPLASGAVRLAFLGHVDHFDLDMFRVRDGDNRHTQRSAKHEILPVMDGAIAPQRDGSGRDGVDDQRPRRWEELGRDIISLDAEIFNPTNQVHSSSSRHGSPPHPTFAPLSPWASLRLRFR